MGLPGEGRLPARLEGLWGYYDWDGQRVIEHRFSAAFEFVSGVAHVCEGGVWTVVDPAGKPATEWRGARVDGRARFCRGGTGTGNWEPTGGRWGYLDENDAPVGSCDYAYAADFREGLAAVRLDGDRLATWAYVDREGRQAIGPIRAYSARVFSEGVARVHAERGFTYVNREGRLLVEPKSHAEEDFGPFANGRACIRRDGMFGYIDAEGVLVIPAQFQMATRFTEDRAAVGRYDRDGFTTRSVWAVIDHAGNEVVPFELAAVGAFHGGVAPAARQIDGEIARWGLLDAAGRWALEPRYSRIDAFCEGVAVAWDGARPLLIDTRGNVVYEGFTAVGERLAYPRAMQKDGKWGYVDAAGRERIAFAYDHPATAFVDGVAGVSVLAPPEEETFPFRFYGAGPVETPPGPMLYYVWLRSHPDSATWTRIGEAICKGLRSARLSFAQFALSTDPTLPLAAVLLDPGDAPPAWAKVRALFERWHEIAAIEEVLCSSLLPPSPSDPWTRWSVAARPPRSFSGLLTGRVLGGAPEQLGRLDPWMQESAGTVLPGAPCPEFEAAFAKRSKGARATKRQT
ncbi:MAG: WG repeat-containing protein [Polyangiaceae bacterium]|nr:WG repeat-containing protein [Polyangiaceae bacterium]